MPLGPELAAIIVPCAVFAVPIVAIVTSHQRKMAEIKARMGIDRDGAALNEIKNEFSALRNEVASLRDTATTFDMSFDAAISRLEQRVEKLEEKTGDALPPLRGMPSTRTNDEQIILGQKG